jgi:NADPH:quinone reductase-like Zn-dependent oxidoreductase
MKAIVLRETGDAAQLKLETLPDPSPGPGEAVVKLKAAALNHRDVWIRKGQYAGIVLPTVLGSDGTGDVIAVGDGVDASWVGRSVIINPGLDWGNNERIPGPDFQILGMPRNGTYAQQIVVPVESLHEKPAGWTDAEAAALPLAGLTAYRAAFTRARVQSTDTVLIPGVGGGVAGFALQMVKAAGAKVVVTSGSDAKLEKARNQGADVAINYHQSDWMAQVKDACSGMGPDVAIDSVGGQTFTDLVELMNRAGRIVLYGATTGLPDQVNLRKLYWNQLDIMGSTMGSPTDFQGMLDFYRKHNLKPVVAKIFPLENIAEAHQYMEQAEQFGKIVLSIPD